MSRQMVTMTDMYSQIPIPLMSQSEITLQNDHIDCTLSMERSDVNEEDWIPALNCQG